MIPPPIDPTDRAGYRHDIFVSYNRKDELFVEFLVDKLAASGFQCFQDTTGLSIFDKLDASIKAAIGRSKWLMAIISPAYLRSYWCLFEAIEAIQAQDLELRFLPIVLRYAPEDQSLDEAFILQALEDLDKQIKDFEDRIIQVKAFELSAKLEKLHFIRRHLPAVFRQIHERIFPEFSLWSNPSVLATTLEKLIHRLAPEAAVNVAEIALDLRRFGAASVPGDPARLNGAGPVSQALVGEDSRIVTLDRNGLALVEVSLKDVKGAGNLVLGSLVPSNVVGAVDDVALATRGRDSKRIRVKRLEVEGAFAFTIHGGTDRTESWDSLRWSYECANAFAADRVDAEMGNYHRYSGLILTSSEGAYLHQVHHLVHELNVKIQFEEDVVKSATAVAMRREEREDGSWVEDSEESRRVDLSHDRCSQPSLTLRISRPHRGYRYGVRYVLSSRRQSLSGELAELLDEILGECRERQVSQGSLVDRLTQTANLAIRDSLAVEDHRRVGFWTGFLWSEKARRLLPAFGENPPVRWGDRFAYGEGITGHAFRIRGPTIYSAGDEPATRTAFLRKAGESVELPDSNWIVAVPLLAHAPGPSIGVLVFASLTYRDPPSVVQMKLGDLAAQVISAASVEKLAREKRQRLNRLIGTASSLFWLTVGESSELGQLAAKADSIYRQHWSPESSAEPSL